MFLMFQLGRLDVWPIGDLGVRAGSGASTASTRPPTPKVLARARRAASARTARSSRGGAGTPSTRRSLVKAYPSDPAHARAGRPRRWLRAVEVTVIQCELDHCAAATAADPRLRRLAHLRRAASYLEEAANAAGRSIEIFARPGAALCDWMPDVEERLPAGPASAVVVVFAGNDNTGCVKGLAGPELIARYERDARRVAELALPQGTPVVLAGPPAIEPSRWAENAELMNERFRAIAADTEGVTTATSDRARTERLSRRTLPCDAEETEARGCDDGVIVVRDKDGVHLDEPGDDGYSAGAARFARALLAPAGVARLNFAPAFSALLLARTSSWVGDGLGNVALDRAGPRPRRDRERSRPARARDDAAFVLGADHGRSRGSLRSARCARRVRSGPGRARRCARALAARAGTAARAPVRQVDRRHHRRHRGPQFDCADRRGRPIAHRQRMVRRCTPGGRRRRARPRRHHRRRLVGARRAHRRRDHVRARSTTAPTPAGAACRERARIDGLDRGRTRRSALPRRQPNGARPGHRFPPPRVHGWRRRRTAVPRA